MSNDYRVRKSLPANAFNSLPTNLRANIISQAKHSAKKKPVTLALVPIRDSERSVLPISKLIDDPNQNWHLDDIEKIIK